MKSLMLLLTLIAFSFFANAQSTGYHAFKVDLGFGYAIPTASNDGGTKAGATFTIQPHYRLSDDIALGLRIEGAALGYENNSDGNTNAKISVLGSYCATGEYYLSNSTVRPFVGAGLGIFTQSSINSASQEEELEKGATHFGVFPEVGLEAGHFRLSADYDVAGSGNNYFAFKIGVFFGGGRK